MQRRSAVAWSAALQFRWIEAFTTTSAVAVSAALQFRFTETLETRSAVAVSAALKVLTSTRTTVMVPSAVRFAALFRCSATAVAGTMFRRRLTSVLVDHPGDRAVLPGHVLELELDRVPDRERLRVPLRLRLHALEDERARNALRSSGPGDGGDDHLELVGCIRAVAVGHRAEVHVKDERRRQAGGYRRQRVGVPDDRALGVLVGDGESHSVYSDHLAVDKPVLRVAAAALDADCKALACVERHRDGPHARRQDRVRPGVYLGQPVSEHNVIGFGSARPAGHSDQEGADARGAVSAVSEREVHQPHGVGEARRELGPYHRVDRSAGIDQQPAAVRGILAVAGNPRERGEVRTSAQADDDLHHSARHVGPYAGRYPRSGRYRDGEI